MRRKKANIGEEAFDALKGALIETSVVFTGMVRADERAEGGHELDITAVEIVGPVNSERPFPITEADMLVEDEDGELTYGGTEHTLNHRHLYLRTTARRPCSNFGVQPSAPFIPISEGMISWSIRHLTSWLVPLRALNLV